MTAVADKLAQLRKLRGAALAEGVTLLILLLVAMPAKHLFGYATATKIVGPVHGVAFVFYIYILIETVAAGDWRGRETARLVVAAFVPFGALASARLLRRKEAALVKAAV